MPNPPAAAPPPAETSPLGGRNLATPIAAPENTAIHCAHDTRVTRLGRVQSTEALKTAFVLPFPFHPSFLTTQHSGETSTTLFLYHTVGLLSILACKASAPTFGVCKSVCEREVRLLSVWLWLFDCLLSGIPKVRLLVDKREANSLFSGATVPVAQTLTVHTSPQCLDSTSAD